MNHEAKQYLDLPESNKLKRSQNFQNFLLLVAVQECFWNVYWWNASEGFFYADSFLERRKGCFECHL